MRDAVVGLERWMYLSFTYLWGIMDTPWIYDSDEHDEDNENFVLNFAYNLDQWSLL